MCCGSHCLAKQIEGKIDPGCISCGHVNGRTDQNYSDL